MNEMKHSNNKKIMKNDLKSTRDKFYEDSTTHCDGGWFGDIKSLAKSTKDTLFPAFEGLAGIVHRSAMSVAAEFAQLERDAELETEHWKEYSYGETHHEQQQQKKKQQLLPLPWEVVKHRDDCNSSEALDESFVEDESFKKRILQLSTTDETFLEPYAAGEAEDFVLTNQRIFLIRRILHGDKNLAAKHAKLSGQSEIKEALFWKNYFYHCDRLRMEYEDLADIDVTSTQSTLGSLIPSPEERCHPDDNSYVCVRNGIASPPSSLNTLTDTLSIGDMVIVGADSVDFHDLDLINNSK
mmetsp:Transcript_39058/g.44542  ORF Transcript_39058/g.44542 Transcript_39058/m.44542 type:complete len:297 (+) Transcript_39058:36-926(+)